MRQEPTSDFVAGVDEVTVKAPVDLEAEAHPGTLPGQLPVAEQVVPEVVGVARHLEGFRVDPDREGALGVRFEETISFLDRGISHDPGEVIGEVLRREITVGQVTHNGGDRVRVVPGLGEGVPGATHEEEDGGYGKETSAEPNDPWCHAGERTILTRSPHPAPERFTLSLWRCAGPATFLLP